MDTASRQTIDPPLSRNLLLFYYLPTYLQYCTYLPTCLFFGSFARGAVRVEGRWWTVDCFR